MLKFILIVYLTCDLGQRPHRSRSKMILVKVKYSSVRKADGLTTTSSCFIKITIIMIVKYCSFHFTNIVMVEPSSYCWSVRKLIVGPLELKPHRTNILD